MDIFPRIGVLSNDAIGTGKNSGGGGDAMNRKGRPMCIIYILIITVQR